MRKIAVILVALSLSACLSAYRSYNENSINGKLRTDGYYTSAKVFTVFDKKSTSYSYIRFLDTENKRLRFSHSARPISPSGKTLKGSNFEANYQLIYNSDDEYADLIFSKNISSFANYTGKINMEVKIKVSDNGSLDGFTFHEDKKRKKAKKTTSTSKKPSSAKKKKR